MIVRGCDCADLLLERAYASLAWLVDGGADAIHHSVDRSTWHLSVRKSFALFVTPRKIFLQLHHVSCTYEQSEPQPLLHRHPITFTSLSSVIIASYK